MKTFVTNYIYYYISIISMIYIQYTSKVAVRKNFMFLSLNYIIIVMIINYICIIINDMLFSRLLRIKIN